jgi:hypothetical protein
MKKTIKLKYELEFLRFPALLPITADCEKTIHNLQFITGDKNKHFSFLSSIILDFNYDRIHTSQQQKPTGVLL